MKMRYQKFLLLLLVSGLAISSQGQQMLTPPEKLSQKQESGGGFTEWYNCGAELYSSGFNVAYYSLHLWPDSTVYVNYSGGLGRPYVHSIGQVFDPLSEIYEDNHPVFSGPYSIDSIAIPYNYFRFQNDDPDTLVIQIFEHNRISFEAYPGFPNGASYATVGYNAAINRGINPDMEVKIPLTVDDTSMASYNFHYLPLGLVVPDGEKIAVTYSYIPGNPYSANDTIDGFLVPPPTNRRNALVVYEYYDFDLNHEVGVYNHAFLATTPIRYGNSNGWNGRYLAGTAYSSGIYHMDVNFLVSNPPLTVGLQDNEETLNVQVYPNPSREVLNIGLPATSNMVQYNLVNAFGQIVREGYVWGGTNQLDITSLESGIYSLRLTEGDKMYTEKVLKL